VAHKTPKNSGKQSDQKVSRMRLNTQAAVNALLHDGARLQAIKLEGKQLNG
jgi:hypothetical protein